MKKDKSSVEEQKLYLEIILSNQSIFPRIQNIYNPINFDKSLQKSAEFIGKIVQERNVIPTIQQVNAITGSSFELRNDIQEIQEGHVEWFLDEFEHFTRREELERAIFKSVSLLEKGEYDPVETLIKDAVQVSLTRDLGMEYFHDPKARLMRLKESNGQVSTGWKDIDDKLYGGFNRGELNIFCGASGSGKSLFLQNISLNFMERGLTGIYISFELSQELVAMRLDSMLTGFASKDIYANIDDVELKVSLAGKKSGRLKIKYMPSQSTVNQVKAYVKELAIQENFHPDFICLDYLDLMMPSGAKVDVADVFTKDKLVCEELRNFSQEIKCLLTTASQLNRTGLDEIDFSPSSIAGGISKLFTADNVMGIFTSRMLKERGAIQIQFLKTRNSGGVGTKVDLDFNVDSLRITNSTQAPDPSLLLTGSNILAQIKNKGTSGSAVQKTTSPPLSSSGVTNEDKKDLLKSLLTTIGKKDK